MAPSPAGAVLESLEMAAGFDNPLVLRRILTVKHDLEAQPPLEKRRKTAREQIRLLFQSQVYIWTVFTLCALLYVVTGIQYWSTKYFIVEKQAEESYVRIVFSATAATAPTTGVFLGAFIIDRMGGYKSAKGMYRSLWFCLFCGVLATGAGRNYFLVLLFSSSVLHTYFAT